MDKFKMKKLILMIALVSAPFSVIAMDSKEGVSLKGSILTIKKQKKYSSVAGCSALAASKNKAAGFTFNNKTQSCTLYRSVSGERSRLGFTSGTK